MRPWFVYILLCDQKTFYVGMTEDVKKRFEEHQHGYPPYTKKFSDIQLVYQERAVITGKLNGESYNSKSGRSQRRKL
jgi:predicted GIY-YIG superfamily endonuclease